MNIAEIVVVAVVGWLLVAIVVGLVAGRILRASHNHIHSKEPQ